jgi:predicted DCC family thiol-disulfide oxidoreductase YuxK
VAERKTIEVYYDGECGLCVGSRNWAEHRDAADRLAFKDLNDPSERFPVPREQLREAMWVRLANGRLESGFRAWLEILRALPGWRLMASALRLPPFRWLGPPIYRLVARHRHLLAPR